MRTSSLPLEGLLVPLRSQNMWRCVILKCFITLIYCGGGEQREGGREKGEGNRKREGGRDRGNTLQELVLSFLFSRGGLGFELRSPVCAVSAFTHWAALPTLNPFVFWAIRNKDVPMRVTHSSSFPTLPGSLGRRVRSTIPTSVSLAHSKKSGHSRCLANKYRICKSP